MGSVDDFGFDPFAALQRLADQSFEQVRRLLTELPKEKAVAYEEFEEPEGKKTAVAVTANDRREEEVEPSLIGHYREQRHLSNQEQARSSDVRCGKDLRHCKKIGRIPFWRNQIYTKG